MPQLFKFKTTSFFLKVVSFEVSPGGGGGVPAEKEHRQLVLGFQDETREAMGWGDRARAGQNGTKQTQHPCSQGTGRGVGLLWRSGWWSNQQR